MSDFYLVIDDPALRTSWDAFLEPRPEADLLQTWSWGEVAGARGERPVRLGVFRDGELVAVAQVLVRPAFAGRSVGYVPHGPVCRREDPEADAILVAVLAGLRAVGIRERAILVKLDPRSVVEGDAARLEGLLRARGLRRSPFDLQARTTRLVPLNGGGEALRAGWDTKARSRVRRAAEAGVEVDFQREPDPAGIAALADRLGDRAFYLYGAIRRGPEGGALFPSYAALAGAMEGLAADGVREIDLWGVVESDAEDGDPSWAGFSEFKRHFKGRPLAHPGTYDLVVARGWDALRARLEGLRSMAGRRGRR